jgi:hypothetical protein
MPEALNTRARKALTTPRAAAAAGILFALLYSLGLILLRVLTPPDRLGENVAWLATQAKTISLALNLIPYAGIAFLWFIGVIRDRIGEQEDRFLATVFLGSGILFLGLTFVGAAQAAGLLNSYAVLPDTLVESGIYTYGRAVTHNIVNVYAARMSGVFMISLGTIWLRTGVMQRGWTYLTYFLALVLLVTIGFSLWVSLIFPAWVFLVSLYVLVFNFSAQSKSGLAEV